MACLRSGVGSPYCSCTRVENLLTTSRPQTVLNRWKGAENRAYHLHSMSDTLVRLAYFLFPISGSFSGGHCHKHTDGRRSGPARAACDIREAIPDGDICHHDSSKRHAEKTPGVDKELHGAYHNPTVHLFQLPHRLKGTVLPDRATIALPFLLTRNLVASTVTLTLSGFLVFWHGNPSAC